MLISACMCALHTKSEKPFSSETVCKTYYTRIGAHPNKKEGNFLTLQKFRNLASI